MRYLGNGVYAITGVLYVLDADAGLYKPAEDYQGYKGSGTIDGVNRLNKDAKYICRCGNKSGFDLSEKAVTCKSCGREVKYGGKTVIEKVKEVVEKIIYKEKKVEVPKKNFKSKKKK